MTGKFREFEGDRQPTSEPECQRTTTTTNEADNWGEER